MCNFSSVPFSPIVESKREGLALSAYRVWLVCYSGPDSAASYASGVSCEHSGEERGKGAGARLEQHVEVAGKTLTFGSHRRRPNTFWHIMLGTKQEGLVCRLALTGMCLPIPLFEDYLLLEASRCYGFRCAQRCPLAMQGVVRGVVFSDRRRGC